MYYVQSLLVYGPLLHLVLPICVCILGFVSAYLASVDVTVSVICGGADSCQEVIYLFTIKSALSACGAMFVSPLIGSLSDVYGRRPFLILLFASFALPYGVLAWSTSARAVYVYFAVSSVVFMMGEGTFTTLIYAYVADTIPPENRATAFGLVGGLTSVGFLGGTLLTIALSTDYIFQVASGFCLLAVAYIYLFVPETLPRLAKEKSALMGERGEEREREEREGKVEEGVRKDERVGGEGGGGEKEGKEVEKKEGSLRDTLQFISASRMLTVVTAVAFLTHLADTGYYNSFLFYLKAAFHWGKNEFSLVQLVGGAGLALSQLVVLPVLSHYFSLRTLLLVGTFFGAFHIFLYGAAWAPWVVYFAACFASISGVVNPVIATMVSKCASPDEQGKLQGVVTSVKSISALIAPLCINPITALFLSDHPPFHAPGFGLIVTGIVEAIGFLLVFALPHVPSLDAPSQQLPTGYTAISSGENNGNESNGVVEYIPPDSSLLAHNILPEVEPIP